MLWREKMNYRKKTVNRMASMFKELTILTSKKKIFISKINYKLKREHGLAKF